MRKFALKSNVIIRKSSRESGRFYDPLQVCCGRERWQQHRSSSVQYRPVVTFCILVETGYTYAIHSISKVKILQWSHMKYNAFDFYVILIQDFLTIFESTWTSAINYLQMSKNWSNYHKSIYANEIKVYISHFVPNNWC